MTREADDLREINARLLSAIVVAAQPDIERVVQAVIDELSTRSAIGLVGDLAARHLWDEYCWLYQKEGISGKLSDHIRAFIEMEIEKQPRHTQVFITAYAYDRDIDRLDAAPGVIDFYAMSDLIEESVNDRAACPVVDLIGHDRADALEMHTTPGGVVCSALSVSGVLWNVLGKYTDELVGGFERSELQAVAEEILGAYLELISDEADECEAVLQFFDGFNKPVSSMLLHKDIIPAIEDLVAEIQALLDS